MKYYSFNDYGANKPIVFSENDIIKDYWTHWKSQMEELKRLYPNIDRGEITKENCIQDWVVAHWAWESTPKEIDDYLKER